MFDKFADQFIDMCSKALKKQKNKDRILKSVIEPIMHEIVNQYKPYVTLFCVAIVIFVVLLCVNISYSVQILSEVKKLVDIFRE